MFLSAKELLFFILMFIVIFVSCKSSFIFEAQSKPLNLIGISLIGTVVLVLVYKLGKIPRCQTDMFHFEVTPEKLCEGFPYMQSSDPELFNYCSKLLSTSSGVQKFDSVNCSNPVFVGRPLARFEYTPESDSKWENKRCNPPYLSDDEPHVL